MLTAFAGPATYLVAFLATFAVGCGVVGKKTLSMGPVAFTGAAMFVLSTLAMNAWRWGDGLEQQLALWRGGLLLDAVLYALVLLGTFRAKPPVAVGGTIAALGFFYLAGHAEHSQIWEVLQVTAIAAMATICFASVARSNLIGRLMWGILMIGEVTAIFQTADCQLLHGMFGTRAEGSACEQVYGTDLSLLPLGIIFAFWSYILWRWSTARK